MVSDCAFSRRGFCARVYERSHKLASRVERMAAYIEEHCREDLTLGQTARVAGLTPSAFSRFFRKMTHRSFVDYRNSCRVQAACHLLEETDLPITEIAFESGFGNLAGFNRRFRAEKRMTPGAYRDLHDPSKSTRAH